MTTARELIEPRDHILVGFEGVLCAPEPGGKITADRLKILIGYDIPAKIAATEDPFEVLGFAATFGAATAHAVERQLCRLETPAVTSAPAIPGVVRAMERLAAAGNTLTVVSRLGADVVRTFLVLHDLGATIRRIAARAGATTPLPPDPHLVLQAMKSLGTSPEHCIMIAGTKADAKAAKAAAIPVITFGMRARGAALAVDDMADLANAGAPELTWRRH
jgi:beta-phosphoglucomutase-like phosphatase (HAD superfamily)